ncbi:MAG TPA: proline--tRNA ligase [Candidatus Pacearchaeota archaeon]|nr:proline--tRNA ligase [Candidatus Pacearchaeota archaeon]
MEKKSEEGITVKKQENFSEWFTQVIDKGELVDLRLDIKGFTVIRPWAALVMENMFNYLEKELQKKGHKPTFMPSVIPKENLKKESEHIKGFTPEVFWLKDTGDNKELALRPTSETIYTPMFKFWVRSYRDLPLKLYQRGSVFRLDTKATRPLIRGREFIWIECHDAFSTKEEAEAQVQEDIDTTEKVMHQIYGVPFLPMKRPDWDKFAGAEYTVGSDCFMPDGKLIQQPSTHLMGQKFSRAFDATFKNKEEKEEYLWTTAYGPAVSRILASVIATHGDDSGMIFPYAIAPVQVIIVPIFNAENKEYVLKKSKEILNELEKMEIKTEIDEREYKRPGEKYHIWELKGVPFRIELGDKEIKNKEIVLFTRDTKKKEKLKLIDLKKIPKLGEQFDKRLKEKADKFIEDKIVNCSNKKEIKQALSSGKLAKINFCSTDKNGVACAEIVEKEFSGDVRGTLASKNEKATGNCLFCGKPATKVIYIGKSY